MYWETLKRDAEHADIFAENLRYYHQKSGYTMRQLADVVGMPVHLLESYESNATSRNNTFVERLAKTLGIHEAALYMRRPISDEIFPQESI
jgi:transcriptional regulator with XRE-family HTH domain